MKFDIIFDHMPKYVLMRTYGEASVHDFHDLVITLVNSLEWVPGAGKLVDHRKLSAKNLTNDDVNRIEEITENYGKQLGRGNVAFVVRDAESFGIVRMWGLFGGESAYNDTRVFYSIDEAVTWLMQ